MNLFLNNILEKFTKTKYYLIVANLLLVFFLVLLSNTGVIPMRFGDFIFFSLMYLIFALYRPGWSFLFFVGTIALENINLAPASIGLFIRPYQLIGGLTIFSLLLRCFTKRLNFELVKLKWFDYIIGVFAFAGFLSSLFAADKGAAFKQSIIIFSFAALYWLVRNYIQTFEDVKKIALFFLSSSVLVVFYGIWQNIQFIGGRNSFEVMPGRPNGTFTEADWLGIFLVLLISVVYLIIYYFSSLSPQPPLPVGEGGFRLGSRVRENKKYFILATSYFLLTSTFILLILTVSRSAWLGAGLITLIFLKAIFTNFSFKFRDWNGKEFAKHLSYISGAILLSIGFAYVFHLTNFQLFNRAQSTGSGLQEITIACNSRTVLELPEKIGDVSELEKYDCRHINLEDIEKEKEAGFEVKEIYRTDPNVSIRSQIYQKSIEQIKQNPFFGIGWGNISNILGEDERGTGLNSSNIFLEVWLGSGIIGLLAFLAIWVYIFIKSVLYCIKDDFESKIIGFFVVSGLFALLIPNLFNAGVYLGILWIWLGAALSVNVKKI
jgi:hypothetical protein